MAIYYLNLKTFGRSDGSSAPGAAAYRAGERIRDERTGRTHDHSARQDVMHKEIVLPTRFADADMGWARDRASLWNAAEAAETRKNARVAREYLVALPRELTPDQRLGLVRGFAQELSDRYRFAVDVAIHAPRDFPGSDPRNFHAHLLATTREVSLEGLAAKTALELSDNARQKLGLAPAVNELLHVRERWATVTNQALEKANVESRIDHRTLAAQGIDREPTPRIPQAAFEAERRGYRSEVAERIRRDYQARVQAREQSATEGRRPPPPAAAAAAATQIPLAAQPQIDAQPVAAAPQPVAAAQPATVQPAPQSLEEIRRQARENWLRLRQQAAVQAAPQAAREATHQADPATRNAAPSAEHRARDDDLSR
jgi:ATP-dependent exoDNAse (exonuclease V) alpha subunit